MSIQNRLNELGLVLPAVAAPVGDYVPAVRSGNLVLTSGQLPTVDGQLIATGKVPDPITIEAAQAAARTAALNAIAAIASVTGNVEHIERIVRLGVFVASCAGFTAQPQVANGASQLMGELFGECGKHARAAVGVFELPLGAAVEIELIAQVRTSEK